MARIAFVQEELRERFGIMILSAVLKDAGHTCEVFVKQRCDDITGDIRRFNPDIIGLSTMTAGLGYALALARKLKDGTGAFILMGGPHPTFYPEILGEKCLDGICLGEGEFALRELADAMDRKDDITGIRNLWIKAGGSVHKNELRELVDVNKLPMCDRDIYFTKYPELKSVPTKRIFIARGCPFSCTYCFNHTLRKMYEGKGSYVRFLDVEKVISEIEHIRDSYGMKWLQIIADTVNINRNWFMKFLEEYKRRVSLPFLCNVRIDMVDEEMVKKMKEAGCDRVDYGVEHGDDIILKDVLKRNMTAKKIVEGGKLFNKYGIRVQTANIIAVPHETVETVMKTVEVNRQVKPEIAKCFILQPYPKTEVYSYSVKNGFLDDAGYSGHGTGFQIDFDGSSETIPLKLKDSRKLVNLFYFFNTLVHFRWIEPLVKLLINLPPNRIFKLIYTFPVIKQDIKYSKSFKAKMRSAKGVLKVLFS